ncbi:YtxC-like family protein [Andreesenia angusta]|uniref:YtxC-like family protein n=1 Tax=Andreesenia angusta TaxID=39480 RepID=A0A1S1VBF1_9FIRM|nr:sporulation protein YtxC [Andreesenia angusta]OHW63159.1 YtxC-like family protein [Andreesenia angusta]
MKKVFVLKKYLEFEKSLERRGFKVSTSSYKSYRTVTVDLEKSEMMKLSTDVFDTVKFEYEKRQIEKYIKRQGYGLRDLDLLSSKVREYISNEKNIGTDITTEKKALEMISNYIEKNEVLDLDGFIKFRMKFYKDAILDFAEMSIYDSKLETDYREFMSSFRYYMGRQRPRQKLVSLVIGEKGYAIIDKDSKMIDQSEVKNIGSEISETGLSKEEMVMGTLISTAPEIIHIYREKACSEELVAEIEEVFKGKVKHIFKDKTV